MPRRNRSRSGPAAGPGAAPHTPMHFRHHAFVRDADARVFDTLHHGLRQRLFDGRAHSRDGIRTAALHQGPPPALARALFVTGCLGILIAALAASELGRELRQRPQDGGVLDAAASFFWARAAAARAASAVASLALAAGAWMRSQARKDIWLLALPSAESGHIDLWLAGTSTQRDDRFAREFTALVTQAQSPVPMPQREDGHQAASG